MKVGWRFPLTDGGREDGYNDPGMAHFGGSHLGSLTRETIQNSLDARTASNEAVQVVFELARISGDTIGRQQLRHHISQCLPLAETARDPKATQELKRAADILEKPNVTFLRVADYNTLGLDEAGWKALVKSQGTSHKSDRSAGGSHGIGKYAPFNVSQLRTVFYWSEHDSVAHWQGKAVLMSHDGPGGRTQGTGFFGDVNGCKSLKGSDIPAAIRDLEGTRSGTSLWIAGFDDWRGWQKHVARSVVENYFCAIADGQLDVLIEPSQGESMFEHWEINRDKISKVIDGLVAGIAEDDESGPLREAEAYYRVLYSSDRGADVVKDLEDPDLGHCRLWIRVEDGLPSKVGLVRKTGMLITSRQDKLLRFPGLRDFAAVLRFESEKGNVLLRDMENPAHDQFEPDRLLPDEKRRRRARRALNRVTEWARRELREAAAPPTVGGVEVVSELAHLLPDMEPDESFGEGKGADRGFGGRDAVELRPSRRTRGASLPDDTADDAGDDANLEEGEDGQDGGAGGEGGGGNGDGGTREHVKSRGTTGGGRARRPLMIRDVRALPQGGDGLRVSFTPLVEAKAAIVELAEAGDSSVVARADLRVVTSDGEVPLGEWRLDLEKERRSVLHVTGDGQMAHRAWRLQAMVGEDAGRDR